MTGCGEDLTPIGLPFTGGGITFPGGTWVMLEEANGAWLLF